MSLVGHTLISIPNDQELAAKLGKKGSANGVTFYNRKVGENVFVIITPSSPATKFNAVAEVLTLSDDILISTRNIDRLFGESIIGCGLLGKSAVLTADQDASAIMQKSGVQSKTLNESELFDYFGSEQNGSEGDPVIEIDHSFSVKGVGAVLLGIVKKGTVRVHDELLSSSGKSISIRSIQSQDQDVKEAGVNTRVGLAIRGAEPEEIEKGDILSKAEVKRRASISAKIKISGMVKEKGFDYSELWLVSGFRSSICKVAQSNGSYEISLSAPLALNPGESFLLVRKEEPRIFAGGSVL